MSNHLSILYTLNGWLYKRAHKINEPLDFDGHTDFELLRDHIFGACSYFLKGKKPIDVEDRLHWMGEYCSRTVQKLHIEIRYEWSGRDRYLWFVLMLHAWVLLTLMEDVEEIQTIPRDLENFEPTDLGIVSYFMQELGQHEFPSVGNEFVEPFSNCQGVVIRGLAGEIVPSEFVEV